MTKLINNSSETTPSLLNLCSMGGCGSKLPLSRLEIILSALQNEQEESTIQKTVNNNTSGVEIIDDFGEAAITLIGPEGRCLISTIDFGTPISDDAYSWGYISAMNALSDVYAVGGIPSTAVSVLGWPSIEDSDATSDKQLRNLVLGASDAVKSVGAVIVGGHSLASDIPFFGLSVSGFGSKNSLMSNNTAEAGMFLAITKRIGSGCAVSAKKKEVLSNKSWEQALQIMMLSNEAPSRFSKSLGIRAAADVTGFGLLGHTHLMAKRSGVQAILWPDVIPLMDAVTEAYEVDSLPGSAVAAMIHSETYCNISALDGFNRFVLCDPQTSGGLLLAASFETLCILKKLLSAENLELWPIGKLDIGIPGRITFGSPCEGELFGEGY